MEARFPYRILCDVWPQWMWLPWEVLRWLEPPRPPNVDIIHTRNESRRSAPDRFECGLHPRISPHCPRGCTLPDSMLMELCLRSLLMKDRFASILSTFLLQILLRSCLQNIRCAPGRCRRTWGWLSFHIEVCRRVPAWPMTVIPCVGLARLKMRLHTLKEFPGETLGFLNFLYRYG